MFGLFIDELMDIWCHGLNCVPPKFITPNVTVFEIGLGRGNEVNEVIRMGP